MAGTKRALEAAVDAGRPAATITHRKRAQKEVINDKSLLLKLPGELRNRIYEYIMEDVKENKKGTTTKEPKSRGELYITFDNDAPIHLKYTSIKSRKRCKSVKQWAAAHERRPYFGLTQACRMLREEFRPLYMSELGFCIDLYVGQYLLALGSNEEEQSIGQAVTNIMQTPLSDDGADLLPFLERLGELKQPRLDKFRLMYGGQRYWDRDTLLAVLCCEFQKDAGGLTKAKTGISNITIVKSREAERYSRPNEDLMLVMDLDANFFVSPTQQIIEAHMRKLLYRFELGELDTLVTQFRWRGKRFTFCSHAAALHGYSPTVALLRSEDL
ncbi:uncharacterized protein J4E88_000706 [Alternaria novae-zelandiae]|uniref:uncharacterized protein n=1 Tax=Alternaria novae-zelandiae TaxID=430562 RepID=UPI0020C3214D|nr:uncharacterized protein J4E88_000706 [Alternaria novae-zelandiae]KAI4696529.1 hypothetical protein J4E88_000706 [Alternaria novae-zelandiae]